MLIEGGVRAKAPYGKCRHIPWAAFLPVGSTVSCDGTAFVEDVAGTGHKPVLT